MLDVLNNTRSHDITQSHAGMIYSFSSSFLLNEISLPSAPSEHHFPSSSPSYNYLDFFGPCSSENMGASPKEPGSKRRSSFKDTVRQAGQAVSNLEQKIEQKLTVLWHEVEEWQRDNHYIESGYRPQSNSFLGSLGRYISRRRMRFGGQR